MTLWASIVAGIVGLVRSIVDWLDGLRSEELGRLKEREANAESDRAVRDAVERADPDSVSDDVFGVGGQDNDLPRTGAGRPTVRPE